MCWTARREPVILICQLLLLALSRAAGACGCTLVAMPYSADAAHFNYQQPWVRLQCKQRLALLLQLCVAAAFQLAPYSPHQRNT